MKSYPITGDRPAPDFFAGALLGNGGLGVVVCTRPDAVVLRFGHNDVWDIRVAERHREKIGKFREVFGRVEELSRQGKKPSEDPWFAEYVRLMRDNYARVYPRPFPCGSLVLGFDRRQAELLGHRLDVATGVCEVYFLRGRDRVSLRVFVDMNGDRVWMQMEDEKGQPAESLFDRVHLIPHSDKGSSGSSTNGSAATEVEVPPLPAWDAISVSDGCGLAFHQRLPSEEIPSQPGSPHAEDRALRLTFASNAALGSDSRPGFWGEPVLSGILDRCMEPAAAFLACVQVDQGLMTAVQPQAVVVTPDETALAMAATASRKVWEEYWSRSAVSLADPELERLWYQNLYFLRCALRPGVTCPGLFANWSFGDIGTAWHGDYHMNYNTQQPFWVTFSSNHCDLNLPYVDLVDHLLPVSRAWAREFYEMEGACFPHSAYPTQMNIMPYPGPPWGWEICETPWTVQGLWWHYLYTKDTELLRTRLFEPMEAATVFLVDYISRPEARGPAAGGVNPRFTDDRWHVYPTVAPELFGLRDKLDLNADCLATLTLTRFLLRAYQQACADLGIEGEKQDLLSRAREVLDRLPDYPTAPTPVGEVFVSVPGADPSIVYNTPNSTMTVFPGEDHGLHAPGPGLEIARNSYRWQQNEGGNELVFLNFQAARMGLLDLEKFKRQVRYCLMPNGTCADMVLQTHGRYGEGLPFDFMARMGVWFENFALPVVVNECLLQSYSGTIRLFPNWPREKDASFRTLRAVGAFLVSASLRNGVVEWVKITSERGGLLMLELPWSRARLQRAGQVAITLEGPELRMETTVGELLVLEPNEAGIRK
jgi:alpha-L-fucosidase 2